MAQSGLSGELGSGSERTARVPATIHTGATATAAGAAGTDLDTLRRYGLRDKPSKGFWGSAFERILRDRLTIVALVVFLLICLIAIFANPINSFVLHQDPNKQSLLKGYQPPTAEHWFGTDEYGRDYAARIIQASQVSILMGFMVAIMALVVGVLAGLVAAFYRGWVDDLIIFIVQMFVLTPSFYILIIMAAWIPSTIFSLAFLIALFGWMGVALQVRGVSLSVGQRDYVQAARALGASNWRIMIRHLLPNISSIVTVVAGFEIAVGILAESGLSYLGLGIRPPTPSWGNMLTNSMSYIFRDPWLVVFPGLFIFITILVIYLMADGLRDALDPRMKNAA